MFMNEYEIEEAVRTVDATETPNLARAIETLAKLVTWTNANSDGWPYWSKPANAARTLMTLVRSVDRFNPTDLTEQQVRRATVPIRAMLTRHGADRSVID